MSNQFLEKIKKIEKDFFTLADLRKIWEGEKASLKVILSRMIKRGKLKRIERNFYILPEKILELEKIANEIYFPSYLSFESALSKYGILSQIPYALTFATPLKTKKIQVDNILIEYRKIKRELFFGFRLKGGIYIAEPEKALADTIYLSSLGKLKINFEELDFSKIKKKRFLELIKRFPLKTQKFVLVLRNTVNLTG